MRRVISLWLPRLSTERIARRERESRTAAQDRPLAAVAKEQGRLVIAAVNGAAQANGIAPGQALADARALLPDLDVADHDPAQDLRLLGHLADWCGRYSPLIALDGNDGLFLDVTGCAHLFGGESAMLADLCRRIINLGFSVRGALADTPGAAWACARYAATAPVVVAPMAARAALGPLPVAALRLSPGTADALARLGLKRIGDLYDLPRAPLAARFGEDVRRRLDAALGESEEPISPRHPLAAHRAQMSFAEPIVAADDVARAVQHLLHGICERLQREQSGARRLELLFYRVDGTFARAAIGTARPLRDPERLALLFAQHLDRLDPGFGVETMALAVPLVESCVPNQVALPHAHPNGTHGDRVTQQDARAALIERLSNRFGPAHVFYLVPRQSHIPERAQRLARALEGVAGGFAANVMRPPLLLAPPHPIEAVAPVPDDPPVLFRWRCTLHRVRRAQGPERIEGEWWRDEMSLRDYYRIEDEGGSRFWLYREGLYSTAAPPRWFLHGLFP